MISTNTRIVFAFSFVILLFGVTAQADDTPEDVLLLSDHQSGSTDIAIDPESGATAIVWHNHDTFNYTRQRLYLCFISQKSGKWKRQRSKTISHQASNPTVAFNTVDDLFLIAWDDLPLDDYDQSKVCSMLLNLKGRKASGITNHLSEGMVNQCPCLVYNPHENEFLLLWYRQPLFEFYTDICGLMTVILDNYGQPQSDPRIICDVIDQYGYIWWNVALSGVYNPRSKNYLVTAAQDVPLDSNSWEGNYYLYKIDRFGSKRAKIVLNQKPVEEDYFTWYLGLSEAHNSKKAYHYAAWNGNGKLRLRKFNSKGKPASGVITVTTADLTTECALAYSPEHDVYLLLVVEEDGLVAHFMDIKGNQIAKNVVINSGDDNTRPAVKWNPVMDKFVIVYVQSNLLDDNVILTTLAVPDEE